MVDANTILYRFTIEPFSPFLSVQQKRPRAANFPVPNAKGHQEAHEETGQQRKNGARQQESRGNRACEARSPRLVYPLYSACGAPMSVQKELMRHASIQTTMNVYGKAMMDNKRQANSKVVEMVLKGKKSDEAVAAERRVAAIGS